MTMTMTRSKVLAALDALRDTNFAAYCQVLSGNWIAASALDDADADYWRSDDAARLFVDIKECIARSQDGAR